MRQAILALALAALLVGCGHRVVVSTTPAPPNSAQTQILNIDKTLADAINGAVTATISLRDQGKVSQADTVTIENWCKTAATVDDQIATEIGSGDPWALQKRKIVLILLANLPGLPVAQDSSLAAILKGISQLFAQIQKQVGG